MELQSALRQPCPLTLSLGCLEVRLLYYANTHLQASLQTLYRRLRFLLPRGSGYVQVPRIMQTVYSLR